ncbi:MAG TPA: aspartate aminotransferase family protein [Candidatus Sulfotelmatobacter sp.]|jgi:4-aminobutyrate aminotransferase|nr:aspartate aminotransferase family protein [Candidatus Sulfotelmatobacter sp.]
MSTDQREGDANLSPRRAAWTAARRGPKAQAITQRDEAVFLRQSLSTPCLTDVVKAEGAWLEDSDGRRILDFHGNSVHHLGHGHPKLKAAIARQMEELPFAPRRFTCAPAVELAERLSAAHPGGPRKVLFAPGGSEAIEIALKIARIATGRHKTVSFWDAFHGAGFAASSVGGESLFRSNRLGPLLPGAEHVAPFACFRCPYGFPSPSGNPDLAACRMACARMLRYVLEKEGDVAAVVAEPIRAVPYLPPPGFWAEVRKACDDTGTLLIFDEIPTGLGKTGTLFSGEHAGAEADITVLGKALGGGMLPLAAVLAKPELDVMADLSIGHYTHEKNPILARAGLTVLEIIAEEKLAERAKRLGVLALERLAAIRHPLIAELRGAGLLLGVELTDGEAADRILYAALSRGLSFKVTMGNTLTLSPPITISETDLMLGLDIVESCIRAEPA